MVFQRPFFRGGAFKLEGWYWFDTFKVMNSFSLKETQEDVRNGVKESDETREK